MDVLNVLGSDLCLIAFGWWLGARRTMKRVPPWSALRLVKIDGEVPDDYVETRDIGRANRVARAFFGRDFRYIVRVFHDGAIVEDIRYVDPHDALDRHERCAKALRADESEAIDK